MLTCIVRDTVSSMLGESNEYDVRDGSRVPPEEH